MSPALTLSPLLAPASSIDWKVSERFALAANAKEMHCYTNALRSMSPAMQYVEGLYVGSEFLLPFEHGWLECDGTVVDPTLPLVDPGREQEWRHFGAFRWSLEQISELLNERGGSVSTPLQRYLPFWGKDEETWLWATIRAHRHIAAVREQRYGKHPTDPADERELLRAIIGDRWFAKATAGAIAPSR